MVLRFSFKNLWLKCSLWNEKWFFLASLHLKVYSSTYFMYSMYSVCFFSFSQWFSIKVNVCQQYLKQDIVTLQTRAFVWTHCSTNWAGMHTYLVLLHIMLLHSISAENQTRAEESTIHFFSMVKMNSEQAATKTQRNSEINPSAWFDIK